MGSKQRIKVMVTGGQATGGPPIGPSLGPLGVNVLAAVTKINEVTKDFAGMKVPVEIIVDTETKDFQVEIGVPTTSALIAKEAKLEKGSQATGTDYVGNITMEQAVGVARILQDKLGLATTKSALLQVLGTCRSMGVKIEGKIPREVTELVRQGEYDDEMGE
jgi:large subunit ribosomal protein L11